MVVRDEMGKYTLCGFLAVSIFLSLMCGRFAFAEGVIPKWLDEYTSIDNETLLDDIGFNRGVLPSLFSNRLAAYAGRRVKTTGIINIPKNLDVKEFLYLGRMEHSFSLIDMVWSPRQAVARVGGARLAMRVPKGIDLGEVKKVCSRGFWNATDECVVVVAGVITTGKSSILEKDLKWGSCLYWCDKDIAIIDLQYIAIVNANYTDNVESMKKMNIEILLASKDLLRWWIGSP